AVIDGNPVGIHFRAPVRAAGIKGGAFGLWNLLHLALHLARGSLIKTGPDARLADGLEQSHRPRGTDVRRVFRAVEAHTDVALGRQIVDFVRLNLSDQPGQRAGVAQIAIMQKQPGAPRMRVVVNRIQAPSIESAGPPNNAVHFVSFGQQQLRQVGPVRSGNSGNERFLSHRLRLTDLKSSRTMASLEKSRYPRSAAKPQPI